MGVMCTENTLYLSPPHCPWIPSPAHLLPGQQRPPQRAARPVGQRPLHLEGVLGLGAGIVAPGEPRLAQQGLLPEAHGAAQLPLLRSINPAAAEESLLLKNPAMGCVGRPHK